jgi:hypothetical protein
MAFCCRRATANFSGGASKNGLRLVHQMTLMTTGLYNEPAGAYLPSVLY